MASSWEIEGEIGFAGLHHGRANRRIGTEKIGRFRHLRLGAPIVVACGEDNLLARRPVGQLVGPGADRLSDEFHLGFFGNDGDQRHQERQNRLRRFGLEVDRVIINDRWGHRHATEITTGLAGVLVAHNAFEAVLDVLGIERRAVGKLDAFAQVETPASIGILLPLLGKARLNILFAAHIKLGQRLADIFHDDATDVGAGGHAGLQQVRLFRQHDLDRTRCRERRRNRSAEGTQDKGARNQ